MACQRGQSDFPHLLSLGYWELEGETPDLGVSRRGGSARGGMMFARTATPEMVSKIDKFSWTEASGEIHAYRDRLSSIGFVGAAASSAAVLQNSSDNDDLLRLHVAKIFVSAAAPRCMIMCAGAGAKRPRALHRRRFECCHRFSSCCRRGRHRDGRQHSHGNGMGSYKAALECML